MTPLAQSSIEILICMILAILFGYIIGIHVNRVFLNDKQEIIDEYHNLLKEELKSISLLKDKLSKSSKIVGEKSFKIAILENELLELKEE